MKKSLITCALLCLSATAVIAQSSDNEDNVVKISESRHRAHRPGDRRPEGYRAAL